MLIGTGLAAPSVQPPVSDVTPPPRAPTSAYGEYLTHIRDCRACHGSVLDGQNRATGAPPGLNLRLVKELTDEQFILTLRAGIDPTGRVLDPKRMPWPRIGGATDDDLRAVYGYLISLP